MPDFDRNTTLQRNSQLFDNRIDNEVVLLSLETNQYYGINPVGSRVWDLLENPQSIAQVCAVLLSEYEVDPAICEKEVTEFVQYLLKEKLLETA